MNTYSSKLFLLLLFLLIFNTASAQNVTVLEMDFATAIEDRKTVNADTLFSADVGEIYCYSLIEGAENSSEIYHVWYHKEEEKARVKLDVKSDRWRTWSSKKIMNNWTGHWRVMVEDEKGRVLASESFSVK